MAQNIDKFVEIFIIRYLANFPKNEDNNYETQTVLFAWLLAPHFFSRYEYK